MAKKEETSPEADAKQTKSRSPIVVVLVALVIAAVGVLAFISGQKAGDSVSAEAQSSEAVSAETSPSEQEEQEEQAVIKAPPAPAPLEIKPGNPTVATLNGIEIKRLDILNFIQTLPAETQQLPVGQLFPLAVEQVINAAIISEKVKGVNLDNDPVVKQNLAQAKEQIIRTVFLQKEVEKTMTDERLQEAYEAYKKGVPQPEEANARHILVEDEAFAKELIAKLDAGEDFEKLAKDNSKDKASGEKGGDIGFFTKTDVVPEFANAAFSMDVGTYTKEPVKSQYGYHVIKLEERRTRPVPSFEESKPFLESQLRGAVLNKLIQDWRGAAKVERFDINGEATKAPEADPAAE